MVSLPSLRLCQAGRLLCHCQAQRGMGRDTGREQTHWDWSAHRWPPSDRFSHGELSFLLGLLQLETPPPPPQPARTYRTEASGSGSSWNSSLSPRPGAACFCSRQHLRDPQTCPFITWPHLICKKPCTLPPASSVNTGPFSEEPLLSLPAAVTIPALWNSDLSCCAPSKSSSCGGA